MQDSLEFYSPEMKKHFEVTKLHEYTKTPMYKDLIEKLISFMEFLEKENQAEFRNYNFSNARWNNKKCEIIMWGSLKDISPLFPSCFVAFFVKCKDEEFALINKDYINSILKETQS